MKIATLDLSLREGPSDGEYRRRLVIYVESRRSEGETLGGGVSFQQVENSCIGFSFLISDRKYTSGNICYM